MARITALHTTTVVDELYKELKARILRGEEPPGSGLSELGVSAGFDVSRPTARAAIERLLGEGLLVREGRRAGPVVPRLTRADIEDLYATRERIEGAAHRALAIDGTTLDLAAAENLRLRAGARADDSVEVVDADIAFHRALVGLVGSARLTKVHELLLAEAHLCMAQVQSFQLLRASVIADEHDAILTAIGSGDPQAALEATSEHLRGARVKLLRHLFGDSGGVG